MEVAKGGEPFDVVVGPGGEDEADGRDEGGGEAAPPEDDVDQGTPCPSVSVSEGVNGLELGVGDGCLDEAGVFVTVDIGVGLLA